MSPARVMNLFPDREGATPWKTYSFYLYINSSFVNLKAKHNESTMGECARGTSKDSVLSKEKLLEAFVY